MPALRIYLALAGASAVQGSIRWWVRDHRVHHRFTDTKKDPYGVNNGIWHAHVGWLLFQRDKSKLTRPDMSDLDSDPVVIWQHRNFLAILFTMAAVLPISVCGLAWQDWYGGLVYACVIRMFFVHQSTFCVNSLAHWLGSQPYDDKHSPKDHLLTAIITFGEGYHNFHHEFPCDYRSAPAWYQYDPTKWLIFMCQAFGLTYNLKTFSKNDIQKMVLQQQQRTVQTKLKRLEWGLPLNELPVIDWDDFKNNVTQSRRQWVVISGTIYDVSGFIDNHPGGRHMIEMAVGRDATHMFEGGVYSHSRNAHNMLSMMRVAQLRGGMEVEALKKQI